MLREGNGDQLSMIQSDWSTFVLSLGLLIDIEEKGKLKDRKKGKKMIFVSI